MDIKLNPGYTKIQQLGNGSNIELSGCCALSLIQVIEFRSTLRKQILKIMVIQQFIHKTRITLKGVLAILNVLKTLLLCWHEISTSYCMVLSAIWRILVKI